MGGGCRMATGFLSNTCLLALTTLRLLGALADILSAPMPHVPFFHDMSRRQRSIGQSGEWQTQAIPKQRIVEHEMTAYLFREVKTQIQMRHPNIVRLYYYFEDAKDVLLLLEYADGGSLFSMMRRRTLPRLCVQL